MLYYIITYIGYTLLLFGGGGAYTRSYIFIRVSYPPSLGEGGIGYPMMSNKKLIESKRR